MNELALVPMRDITEMANAISKSNFFGLKTPEQAAALMLVAQADGLHPAKAATHYHIIQGKPSLSADAMLARFQAAGGRVKWETYGDDAVIGTFTHAAGGSVTIRWDIDRAKKAGVQNLQKFPAAMMRARCISEGVRTVYPGVIVGMYTPEEVSTFAPPEAVQQALPEPRREFIKLSEATVMLLGCETIDDLKKVWFEVATNCDPDDLAKLTQTKDEQKATLLQ
jgi:hypothetical protein